MRAAWWGTTTILGIAATGCIGVPVFRCDDSPDCRAGAVDGACESTGFCSFPTDACASGRRYGELAGELANQCVGGGDDDPDGGGDPDGLMGLWHFDGDAFDASGESHHGEHLGNPSYEPGKLGMAIVFDGDDSITVPSLAGTASPASGTIAFWMRDDGTTDQIGGMFDNFDTERRHIFVRAYDGDTLQIAAQDPALEPNYAAVFQLTVVPQADGWHHLTVVWDTDADTLAAYLFGEPSFTEPLETSFVPDAQTIRFGLSMVGAIDEVRLYDRALDAAAVAEIPR